MEHHHPNHDHQSLSCGNASRIALPELLVGMQLRNKASLVVLCGHAGKLLDASREALTLKEV